MVSAIPRSQFDPCRRRGSVADHACYILFCSVVVACGLCWPAAVWTSEPGDTSAVATIADALENRNWESARELLEQKEDPSIAQADGTTALHWAVFHDRPELIAKLLAQGCVPDVTNRYAVSPLALACENGSAKATTLLLEAGADPNLDLPGRVSPMMLAARTGVLECVELLAKHGAEVDQAERRKQTALMWAAAEGHVEVVQFLVSSGADLDRDLDSGFSPLMFAVRNGRAEVVRALIESGADVNEQMNPKRTGGRHPRRGMSALHLAIENGHYELGEELLKLGADPNDQRCGFTPLHNLTWVRKPPRGDNVDGAPPPIGSGNMTSLQFIRVLVENGADVNARLKKGSSGRGKMSHKGATPFLFASRRDDIPMMKLLLELGADPTIPNVDNCTPLLVAAGIGTLAPGEEAGTEEEALEAVELLLSLGADINHVDDNGETAMHGATYKSLPRMVNYLAVRGADVNVWNQKNKHGWTPTLIAEGHRPGNFKPAAATLTAVYRQLRANGITPPPKTPRQRRKGYN
ncbi:MAG: ankyrin repeat domain-containing protein [Planctomycetota bacterium]